MNAFDSSLYPVTSLPLGTLAKAKNSDHWREVYFYEQQIIHLELSLGELHQRGQLGSPLARLDEAVRVRYISLQHHYTRQLERACMLRKLALMRLYWDCYNDNGLSQQMALLLGKIA